eukprot:COSAG06_NODE_6138_length_3090_cov_1.656971_4_plen_76_part_00
MCRCVALAGNVKGMKNNAFATKAVPTKSIWVHILLFRLSRQNQLPRLLGEGICCECVGICSNGSLDPRKKLCLAN